MSEQTNLTAVEWIIKQLSEEGMLAKIDDIVIAKQMEKEQIMKANIDGYEEAQSYGETSAEQYYNETYKK